MKLIAVYDVGNRLRVYAKLTVRVPRFSDNTYRLSKYLKIRKVGRLSMMGETLRCSGSDEEQEKYLIDTLYNSPFYIDYFYADSTVMWYEPLNLHVVLYESHNVSKYLSPRQIVSECKRSLINGFVTDIFYGPFCISYHNYSSLKVDTIETGEIRIQDIKALFTKKINPNIINLLGTCR
jgi:hypothetical protein